MKTRFAPSPTGYLHLGNVRTALFNALLAKHSNGIFLLRIEDTDQSRSADEFVSQLKEDLEWLTLSWQEGPFFQSQRQAIYNDYYHQLEMQGLIYPCFCTDQELAIARKIQLSSGQPPRYPGTCRNLTEEEVKEKQAKGLASVLRFRVPDNQVIEFDDLVHGNQIFKTNEIGDFIICRSDRTPAFFFCNAIDDSLMGVTHALRGEDHLTNTPRQLLMLRALKLREPQYVHMPLILGKDGSPLSKRHGSHSVKEMREMGYLPLALLNYLARLGHYYAENHFMSLAELAERFAVKNLGNAPARFDADQLLYWQKQAVQQLSDEAFWIWLGHDIQSKIPANQKESFITTIRPNIIFPQDALVWIQVLFGNQLSYREDAVDVFKNTEKRYFEAALQVIAKEGINLELVTKTLQQNLNLKGKTLYQPLRLALTGEFHGPEMPGIMELLGIEKISQRLKQAEQYAKNL